MLWLVFSIFFGVNSGAADIVLKDSKVSATDGPFWIQSWELNKPQGITLRSLSNYDQVYALTFDGADFAYLNNVNAKSSSSPQPGVFNWAYEDDKVSIQRVIHEVPNAIEVEYSAHFKNKAPAKAYVNLVARNLKDDPEERDRSFIAYTNGSVDRYPVYDMDAQELPGTMKWLGLNTRYFLLAAFPTVAPAKVLLQPTGESSAYMSMEYPLQKNELNLKFKVAFTSKQIDLLRDIDKSLDTAVDLGWFTVIAYPILWLLKFLNKYLHNYGLAIIVLTIIIKILLFPLVVKSVKGMKKMAEVQPRLKALQEKHKKDKEALTRETMALMKTANYNPVSGCLPLLLQMPVFFALYQVLYAAVELYKSPFALWITDLSARDPYYITPVLMTGVMFIQQLIMPVSAGMDPTQQKVMKFMPLMFGAFMLTTPAGLCIYMLCNTIVSIAQQMYLNKKYGLTTASAAVTSI